MAGGGKQLLSPGWAKCLKNAIELDSWGQREEAKSAYERCANLLPHVLFTKLSVM